MTVRSRAASRVRRFQAPGSARLLTLLFLALALVAASAVVGTDARAWDGCTTRAGDIRFRAADGTRLVGHRFGHGTIAVALAHQIDGDMCQWVSYAQRLARLGYSALAFDMRGYGQSQTRNYPANQRYGADVAAAVKLARRSGAKKVFLVGASMGGSAVLDAGANVRPQVDGVVSVSGAADLVNGIGAVKHLHAPVLFIAGALDVDFAHDARRLYAATASKDKLLKVLPNVGEHGTELVDARPMARALIERFLHAH